MSRVVNRQTPFLRLLLETPSISQKRGMLDTITADQLKALTEITHNFLQNVIPVTPRQKKTLRKYKRMLELLGDPRVGPKRKKKALCRQTRAITLLLRVVEPALKTFLR
jgi:hypothetical protein